MLLICRIRYLICRNRTQQIEMYTLCIGLCFIMSRPRYCTTCFQTDPIRTRGLHHWFYCVQHSVNIMVELFLLIVMSIYVDKMNPKVHLDCLYARDLILLHCSLNADGTLRTIYTKGAVQPIYCC